MHFVDNSLHSLIDKQTDFVDLNVLVLRKI